MLPEDKNRLGHMIDAAHEAVSFMQGKTREDLETDRLLVLGTVKAIEIIGEAARHLSAELCAKHPEIPWHAITGMRNRLVHAYFDIDLDRVQETVEDDLPPLIEALERMLPAMPPGPGA
jgi:uncharacterized protein with HEPN domain